MTLTVEDGTGIEGAESYVSVADANTYWGKRITAPNYGDWDGATDLQRESALREASAYLDITYGLSYLGRKAGDVQGLLWPRTNAKDYDETIIEGVPSEIVTATIELAGRALVAPLAKDLDRGGKIKSLKAGSVSLTYADHAPAQKQYSNIEQLMERVCMSTSKGMGWSWA